MPGYKRKAGGVLLTTGISISVRERQAGPTTRAGTARSGTASQRGAVSWGRWGGGGSRGNLGIGKVNYERGGVQKVPGGRRKDGGKWQESEGYPPAMRYEGKSIFQKVDARDGRAADGGCKSQQCQDRGSVHGGKKGEEAKEWGGGEKNGHFGINVASSLVALE